MARHIAKLICLAVAGIAGWKVLVGLAELYNGWVPPAFGVGTMVVVAVVLYFPLARPVSDMLSNQMTSIVPPSRHVRAGTGLDEIPTFSPSRPPPPSNCNLCGGPGGPICEACDAEMKR